MKINCLIKNFIIVLCVLLITLIIEIFGFNYRYFLLPKENRGVFPVNMEKIELNNMKIENNYLIALNNSASIKIIDNENKDILGLQIVPASTSAAFEVSFNSDNGNNKINLVDPKINSIATLKIEKENKIIDLNFTEYFNEQDRESVSIKEIMIDNTFSFNFSRFFLFFSLLTLFLILIVNYKFFTSKLHIAFIVIALTFGINIVYLTPTYFSFDEREHFIKAYQTASFDFGIGSNDKKIEWPENIEPFFTFNGKSTSFDSFKEKEAYYNLFSQNQYNELSYFRSTAETYMPTAYIPAAIGIFLGKILSLPIIGTFYLGRLFNLFFYSMVFFFSIKYIKIAQKVVFVLGLLPAMLYVGCAYSADPVTYSFSIAVVSLFCNMFFAEKRTISLKMILLYLGCASIMVTGKMTYIPLGILLLLIPNDNFRMRKKEVILSKIVGMFFLGGVLLLNLVYSAHNGLAQWPIEGISTKGQIIFIIENLFQYFNICLNFILNSLPTYFEGPIGNFAYSGSFSAGISVMATVLLFLLAVIDNNEITGNFRFTLIKKLGILTIIILSWLLTISSLYITFTPVGSHSILGVQGRYFAPLLFPLLLLFKTDRIKNSFDDVKLKLSVISISFFALSILAFKLLMKFSF